MVNIGVEGIVEKIGVKIKNINRRIKLEEREYNEEIERLKKLHNEERDRLEDVYLTKGNRLRIKRRDKRAVDLIDINHKNYKKVKCLHDLRRIKKKGVFDRIKGLFSRKKLDVFEDQLNKLNTSLDRSINFFKEKREEDLKDLLKTRETLIVERKKLLKEYNGPVKIKLIDLKKKIDLLEKKKSKIGRIDLVDRLNTEIRKRNRFLKECQAIFEKQKKSFLVDKRFIGGKLNEKELRERLAIVKKDFEISRLKGRVYSRRIMKQIKSTERVLGGLEQKSFKELVGK